MYVRQLSLLQLLIWASYRHFKERMPEAICCCLQTCNVDVVLLVMHCMYIPVSLSLVRMYGYIYAIYIA